MKKLLIKNIDIVLFDFKRWKEPEMQQQLINSLKNLWKKNYI